MEKKKKEKAEKEKETKKKEMKEEEEDQFSSFGNKTIFGMSIHNSLM